MPASRLYLRVPLVLILAVGFAIMPFLKQGPSGQATGDQARPVIDTDYLYRQLYEMASNYIFRASGFDGPPQNPSSPANLPPNINGWQEFYAHWKTEMTSQAVMGPLARYVTVSDHFFRPATRLGVPIAPYDSDVREVTIPGAACPGERVLIAGHPDSTPPTPILSQLIDQGRFDVAMQLLYSSNLGNGSAYDDTSGTTMGMAEFQALLHWWQANGTWPARTIKVGLFDAEETGLFGSQYYAAHLIPRGPQGQYVLVANMDQNGLEYPAYHWGTDHYFNDLKNGGVGPWYTNINASPLAPNNVYNGDAWKKIEANLPAIKAFRAALSASVTDAFAALGAKYHYQMPLENPLLMGNLKGGTNPKVTVSAYAPEDQQRYSPVQDDSVGRTDQVPFVALGIPAYGVLGAYDTNNIENPYPVTYTDKPVIFQYAGYDTLVDTMEHLNYWASGTPHGLGGPSHPSEALKRALELPATWSAGLLARSGYGGAVAHPSGPVAYFETTPVQPGTSMEVSFDGSFSADAAGSGKMLHFWDFGDGTYAIGPRIKHSFAKPIFADVRLVVIDGKGEVSGYRQAVDVGGTANPPPATPACGTLTMNETRAVAEAAKRIAPTTPSTAGAVASSQPWTPSAQDYTDPVQVMQKLIPGGPQWPRQGGTEPKGK